MSIHDLYSKRQRRARGELPDVYRYDEVPTPLRVQVVHIISDTIGVDATENHRATRAYAAMHDVLAREYGVFKLSESNDKHQALLDFLLTTKDPEQAIDLIEVAFRYIDGPVRAPSYAYHARPKMKPDAAIAELNGRLREHAVGFQYESGEMIRVDSQVIHAEVVRPALQLLRDPLYQGANNEYLKAHEHYRHDRFEESITDCLKALESALKAICHKRGWEHADSDTAKRLLDVVFTKQLLPGYLQSEFSALRTSLESGVPTVRNKQGGHGQGTQVRQVPRYLASYLVHLTATSILFLIEAEKSLS